MTLKPNEIVPANASAIIIGTGRQYRLLVDAEDFETVSNLRLLSGYPCPDGRVYARSCKGNCSYTTIYVHRFLMEAKSGQVVDHINGDTLDCRRENLRVCTQAENTRNRRKNARKGTTPYKGVYLRGPRFLARIGVNRKVHHLGTFETAEQAARAYDKGALLYHGEFARLNFPTSGINSALRVTATSHTVGNLGI